MIVLVFGIQGSGKSTHAHFIANQLNLPYVSTGDILRELEKQPTEIGKKVKGLMESGNLIPDKITFKALDEFMETHKIENDFVMEGFPRSLEQVKHFKYKPDIIFEFVVPEEVAIARLQDRGRYDDVKDSIQRRFSWFKEKNLPVIEYYKKSGVKVFIVSNEPSIAEVQENIDELLKNQSRN